ncbi:SAV_2336 N-terminal domain-related protein [Streptomyces uncialis]|uniref:SAV_2336 N-terminal domain-related protein n=1 Tax=Streptomyces uncialis TaxID=1048205 RepID=UPI00094004E1|nr:SAV_2336 N-terminal domain-related protein [Streptomyces uncialis]
MPTESGPLPSPVARLAAVLTDAARGTAPTPTELAELLWLAGRCAPGGRPGTPVVPQLPGPDPGPDDGDSDGPDGDERTGGPGTGRDGPPPPEPGTGRERAVVHLPGPAPRPPVADRPDPVGRAALLVPAPPMLARPLALQRALRPLARKVPAPHGRELDEEATADRIARLGPGPRSWLPVLRPARERWLRLHLVHDTGPTMPLWRPLVRELRTVLERSGVFRTVEVYRADADGTVRGPRGGPVPALADGRTVTLLFSDCVGPQWWDGPAGVRWYGTLRRWADRMPVAVLQPLPERLWRATALPAAPGRLSSPAPAAPNSALVFTPYDPVAPDGVPRPGPAPVALPVLEVGPGWLGHWSALIAGPGGTREPGAAARLHHRPVPVATDDPARDDARNLSATDLVARFRATASPEAFRLAGHLALGTPRLPVMRLVQAATEARPSPQHLAEVVLSGMLTGGARPSGWYAFRPGVREVLLRSLPRSTRSRTEALLARVGALIDAGAGTVPGGFPMEVAVPDAAAGGAPGGPPVATVGADSLRYAGRPPAPRPAPDEGSPRPSDLLSWEAVETAGPAEPAAVTDPGPDPEEDGPPAHAPYFDTGVVVGGRYRLEHPIRPGGGLWLAGDPVADRTVVIQAFSVGEPEDAAHFERTVRLLRELRDPNIVRVLGSGRHGAARFIAMEHLDGIPLNALAAPQGFVLPARLFVSVAAGLAAALDALGRHGVVHGSVGTHSVVVLPDGTPRLTLFELDRAPGPDRRREDLRRLGSALAFLASSSSTAEAHPTPRNLNRLPQPLRAPVSEALTALLHGSADDAAQALNGLRNPELRGHARRSAPYLRYRLLGPVQVWRTGAPPPDPAGGPRPVRLTRNSEQVLVDSATGGERLAVLVQLLLRHGRTVTHDRLVEKVWDPAERPAHASAVLSEHVSRLRRALGPCTVARLPDGYALHISPDQVDLLDLDSLAAEARNLRGDGDPARASRAIRTALQLWQGTPLDGVPGPGAAAHRERLTALRLELLTTLAELDLEQRRFADVADDLAARVREHPEHVGLRALRMRALYELGRHDEALEVYDGLRAAGGRPGPAMDALHREVADAREAAADGPGTDSGPWAPGTRTREGNGGPARHPVSSVAFDVSFDIAPRAPLAPAVRESLHRVLAGLTRRPGGLRSTPTGYVMAVPPGGPALALLPAVVLELPGALAAAELPPLLVSFLHEDSLADSPARSESALRSVLGDRLRDAGARVLVAVSRFHEESLATAPVPPQAVFRPLYRRGVRGPVCSYALLTGPPPARSR